jgi:hypothetical protein
MSASCDGAIRYVTRAATQTAEPAPYLIALTGPAGCGKSTAARLLGHASRGGAERVRFAGPIKAALRAIGLTEAQTDGDEKEIPCDLLCGKTPRQAMQLLGAEWGRDLIGSDLWVRTAMHRVYELRAHGRNIVIDDCRFDNEAIAVREAGGHVIYLTGRCDDSVPSHASEAGVSPRYLSGYASSAGSPAKTAREILRACGVYYPSI